MSKPFTKLTVEVYRGTSSGFLIARVKQQTASGPVYGRNILTGRQITSRTSPLLQIELRGLREIAEELVVEHVDWVA